MSARKGGRVRPSRHPKMEQGSCASPRKSYGGIHAQRTTLAAEEEGTSKLGGSIYIVG